MYKCNNISFLAVLERTQKRHFFSDIFPARREWHQDLKMNGPARSLKPTGWWSCGFCNALYKYEYTCILCSYILYIYTLDILDMYLAIWNGIQFLSVLFFQKDLGNRPPPRRRSNQVSRPVLANLELPVSFRAAVYLDIFGWHSGLPAFQEAPGGSMGLVCETFTRSNWWFRTTFFFESTLEDFF